MGTCKNCKNYGRLNESLGERCFIRGETEYPSGFKHFNGYVRAFPIPKERTCKNFTLKDGSASSKEDEE